ncbi:unnamed protein product [Heterobilharzia americana]|nr:unnamed protein product [Heterobilharzia americana]
MRSSCLLYPVNFIHTSTDITYDDNLILASSPQEEDGSVSKLSAWSWTNIIIQFLCRINSFLGSALSQKV